MLNYLEAMLELAPVAYWRLDEPSGNLVSRVGGHEMTPSGTMTRSSKGLLAEDHNPAILFGGGSAVTTNSATWALGGEDFSVSLIVQFTSTTLGCPFAIRIANSTILLIFLTNRMVTGDLAAETWCWSDTATRVRTPGPVNTGRPLHVVVTYQQAGKILTFYVNGGLVDQRAQTGVRSVSFSPVLCVGNNPGASQAFAGTVDEVAVFDRLLHGFEARELGAICARGPATRRLPSRRLISHR